MHERGVSKKQIAKQLNVSRPTVINWLDKSEYSESRGWPKDKKRTHTEIEQKRIIQLKQRRNNDCYLVGAPHVQMDYAKQYPKDPLPSEWFVKSVTRKAGLQSLKPKDKKKKQNIVSRLLFPIKSIISLGRIHQSVDFVGKKYIAGSADPVHIFATAFYQWFKLYKIWRVSAETADEAIAKLVEFWTTFPLTNVLRMDNSMTFRGTGREAGRIGKFLKFLLNLSVIPLFASPYQSYTNPHIEGCNRTFDSNFWKENFFVSVADIDRESCKFNAESEEFFNWKFKERLNDRNIHRLGDCNTLNGDILRSIKGKKICFIRFVESWKETNNTAGIVILDRFVKLPAAYLNQYVFVTLNLETAKLSVVSEHQGIIDQIISQPFEYTL